MKILNNPKIHQKNIIYYINLHHYQEVTIYNSNYNDYLNILNAPILSKHGFTGKNINVAIIEDKILSIPGKLNIKGWFDVKSSSYSTTPPNESLSNDHSFSTASLIGGVNIGVAPDCNLYNVIIDTNNSDFNITLAYMKKAIKWCLSNNSETTLIEGDIIQPMFYITPRILNNQDIFIKSSNDDLVEINHYTNSIKAVKKGKLTLDFCIPKKNYTKTLSINILSTLDNQIQQELELYNIPYVQNKGYLGDNIKVAILDSSVNIVGNIDNVIYGPNYIAYQPTTSVLDNYGQGTVTASIVKQIAPNCTIYSVKIKAMVAIHTLMKIYKTNLLNGV